MKSWCLVDSNLCPPSAPLASGISLQLLRERHPSSQPPRCLPLPRLSGLSRGNQTLPGKSCFISTYTPPRSQLQAGGTGRRERGFSEAEAGPPGLWQGLGSSVPRPKKNLLGSRRMQGGRKSDCLALAAPRRVKRGDNWIYNITRTLRLHLRGSPYSYLPSEARPGRQFAGQCPAPTWPGGSEQRGTPSRVLGPHARWWAMRPAPLSAAHRRSFASNLECKTQKKKKKEKNPNQLLYRTDS